MKKVIHTFLIAIFFYSSPFVAFTNDDSNEKKSCIYFCTRDVEEYGSTAIPSSKSLDNNLDLIVVGDSDSADHKLLRHCFILMAKEASHPDNGKLILEIEQGASRGYYPDGTGRGNVLSEDFWLFSKEGRDERTVSCTPIMKEGDSKVDDEGVVSDDEIYIAWHTLLSKMSQNVAKNPYFDQFVNNCCSVAFESLRDANKELKHPFDLSGINKRSYNVFGIGISLSKTDDSVLDFVKGSSRLSSDVIRAVWRTIVKEKPQIKDNTDDGNEEL